jgi:hypothetical protein
MARAMLVVPSSAAAAEERMQQEHEQPSEAVETPVMMALAFNDAVRDIVAAEGVFRLPDEEGQGTIWEWDGVRWRRVTLDEGGHDDGGRSPGGDDEAVASAS